MGVLISDTNFTARRDKNRLEKLADWIEFRIEHLKKRYAAGEESAYIRLTEIEALKEYMLEH